MNSAKKVWKCLNPLIVINIPNDNKKNDIKRQKQKKTLINFVRARMRSCYNCRLFTQVFEQFLARISAMPIGTNFSVIG